MRSSILFAVLAQIAVAAAAQPQCPTNGNNCARAVTATFQNQQTSRAEDCASFQRCTVSPATSTFVVTSTVTPSMSTFTTTASIINTVTVAPGGAARRAAAPEPPVAVPVARREVRVDAMKKIERRQANTAVTHCPTAVPSYASACTTSGTVSGTSAAYASACSCAGFTRSYSTVSVSPFTSTSFTTLAAVTTTTTVSTVVATNTISPVFIVRIGSTGSTYVDTYTDPGATALHYDSITPVQAVQLVIFNGVLAQASDLQPFSVLANGGQSYLVAVTASGFVGIPASFGAYNGQAAGFALTLSLASPNDGLYATGGSTSEGLVQAPMSNYPPLPGPLYAVLI